MDQMFHMNHVLSLISLTFLTPSLHGIDTNQALISLLFSKEEKYKISFGELKNKNITIQTFFNYKILSLLFLSIFLFSFCYKIWAMPLLLQAKAK